MEINKNLNGVCNGTEKIIEKHSLDLNIFPGGAHNWLMAELNEDLILIYHKNYGVLLYNANPKNRHFLEYKNNSLSVLYGEDIALKNGAFNK